MSKLNVWQDTPWWSGEHWIIYLRPGGGGDDVGMFSLYNTRYSEAGEGVVAFIRVLEPVKFEAVCTDNRKLAAWIMEKMIRGKSQYFDMDLPVVVGRLERGGDTHSAPSWQVEAGGHRVSAQWTVTDRPTIVDGRWPGEVARHCYSVLFFTDDACMTIDGQAVAGQSYVRDIWQPTLKADKSSCVFALSETFIPWQGE